MTLSATLAQTITQRPAQLEGALDYAARRGVIVVAAAGNQGSIGSTPITRHPWVIPEIACDREGRPIGQSNLGNSIGRHGRVRLAIRSPALGPRPTRHVRGANAAVPFVTGATALLWSVFPAATATEVKSAVMRAFAARRGTVVPPVGRLGGVWPDEGSFPKEVNGVEVQFRDPTVRRPRE